jgi:uncharacterized protein (TIGR00251 family)
MAAARPAIVTDTENMGIPFKKTKNGITIEVKVEPRSSQKGIAGIMGENILKVKLTAPPVDGAANEQLIEVIAEEFKVKKSQVKVIRGHSSKVKVVEITGVETV